MMDILKDGIVGLWGFLNSSFVAFVLGVVFTAFVALRAFYIQKRHERMAEKYDDIFERLAVLIKQIETVKNSPNVTLETEVDGAIVAFLDSSLKRSIYFSAEARLILDALPDKVQALPQRGSVKEYQRQFWELLKITRGDLVEQATKDLRPNLIGFAKEFFTVFIHG